MRKGHFSLLTMIYCRVNCMTTMPPASIPFLLIFRQHISILNIYSFAQKPFLVPYFLPKQTELLTRVQLSSGSNLTPQPRLSHPHGSELCLPWSLTPGLLPALSICHSCPSVLRGSAPVSCSSHQDSLPIEPWGQVCPPAGLRIQPPSIPHEGSSLPLDYKLARRLGLNPGGAHATWKCSFLLWSTSPRLLAWLMSTHSLDLCVDVSSSGKPSSTFRSGWSVPLSHLRLLPVFNS